METYMGGKVKVLRSAEKKRSAKQPSWQPRKTALITGATSGIGYDLSRLLARKGYNLILVARTKKKLEELSADLQRMHSISTKAMAKDLTDPKTPEAIYREITNAKITIDLLVNNAGAGVFGAFSGTEMKSELDMIQLNVTTLAHLIKLFLPEMVKRREGKILNVASTAAFQPGPFMANYYASKSYVVSLSVALASELKGTGVTVSVLCPGPTRTEFHKRANMEDSGLMKLSFMESDEVARIGYEGLMKGRTVIIPGTLNKIGTAAAKLSPLVFAASVVKRLQGKRTSR